MANPKTQFPIIFFVFSLSFIIISNLESSQVGAGRSDFDEWVSWHADNYKNNSKNILETDKLGVTGRSRIDLKLMQAEVNKRLITVSQDGSGNYTAINDAIRSIPVPNTQRVVVSIKPGIYREKIVIDKKRAFVTLKADDYNNPPKITWNDFNNRTNGTLRSATVAVNSDYFVAINIIFENTIRHERGVSGSQAVALQISGTKGAFYNCTFSGFQDTLYDRKGLHYFKDCSIYGDVDFICGYGQSFYEGCVLNYVGNYDGGTITAQKRSAVSMASGFSFKNCIVRATNNNTVYLGRSWGDRSRVVYSFTYMDKIVLPKGWDDWSNPENDRTVYYGEYKCSGPGSNMSSRVYWARNMTDEEVKPFLGTYFVEGDTWILDPHR